ncbi:hypothetical protein [Legionella rowbothamii]|uniref:hypothetical protein n=1 Tax=Legionella rowbothamii TaxID=96229 RepID=UPI0010554F09|nr:hypothetical protein [Legionella rowbothamii]
MTYAKQEPQQTKPYTKEELKNLRDEMVALKQGIRLPQLMVHGVFAAEDIKLKRLSVEKQTEVSAFIEKLKTNLIAHGADTSNIAFKADNLSELCSLFKEVENLAKNNREDKVNPEAKSSIFSCFGHC